MPTTLEVLLSPAEFVTLRSRDLKQATCVVFDFPELLVVFLSSSGLLKLHGCCFSKFNSCISLSFQLNNLVVERGEFSINQLLGAHFCSSRALKRRFMTSSAAMNP